MNTRKAVDDLLVRCELGCRAEYPSAEFDRHECPPTICGACSMEIYPELADEHKSICSHRPVTCEDCHAVLPQCLIVTASFRHS